MYVAQLHLASWTLGVWGWTRVNIFHSEHIPSNLYYWHFVNRLQELEIWKCDGTTGQVTDADAVRTDRCEGWNSYVDRISKYTNIFPVNFVRVWQLLKPHVEEIFSSKGIRPIGTQCVMPPTYTQYDFHVFYGTNISVTLCWYAFANYCIRTWYFLTITYSLFTRLNQGALRLTSRHILTYNWHFCWAWYFSTITCILPFYQIKSKGS